LGTPSAFYLGPARALEARAVALMSRDLGEPGLDWRYTPARMAALLADPETSTVVACAGDRPHGFAVMQFGDDRAHLALLAVQPTRQRRGVGRALVDWLLASARVAGIAAVELELRADNAGALAFYRRLGFDETGVEPAYYDGIVAARRMRLALAAGA
jgi:ribosomal-protein-alanine N-acetyltransferase